MIRDRRSGTARLRRTAFAAPQARLLVPAARRLAARVRGAAEPKQSLRGDRRGGAVDRLVVVERIGRAVAPLAERGEAGRAGIPVRDAVGGGASSM